VYPGIVFSVKAASRCNIRFHGEGCVKVQHKGASRCNTRVRQGATQGCVNVQHKNPLYPFNCAIRIHYIHLIVPMGTIMTSTISQVQSYFNEDELP
jgi:hypothetical protein